MIASEGPAVDSATANAAPILDQQPPSKVPTLNYQRVPGLPDELQPDPGDVLLSRAFWPWDSLGALGIPEHWLYMSRKVQGVIAQFVVQTDTGPQLLKAQPDGTLSATIASGTVDVTDRASRLLGRASALPIESGIGGNPPSFFISPFDVALAAGATLDLIGSQAGVGICLLALHFQIVTAGAAEVTLENRDGTSIYDKLRTDALQAGSHRYFGIFTEAGIGGKVRLHNTSGVAAGTIAGTLIGMLR